MGVGSMVGSRAILSPRIRPAFAQHSPLPLRAVRGVRGVRALRYDLPLLRPHPRVPRCRASQRQPVVPHRAAVVVELRAPVFPAITFDLCFFFVRPIPIARRRVPTTSPALSSTLTPRPQPPPRARPGPGTASASAHSLVTCVSCAPFRPGSSPVPSPFILLCDAAMAPHGAAHPQRPNLSVHLRPPQTHPAEAALFPARPFCMHWSLSASSRRAGWGQGHHPRGCRGAATGRRPL